MNRELHNFQYEAQKEEYLAKTWITMKEAPGNLVNAENQDGCKMDGPSANI
jgi:hypothetical protein